MDPNLFKTEENHLRFLDSARGIASFMVFAMHFFEQTFIGTSTNTYISIFINGRDAVSFFFVLSGFVLSYKYLILGKPLDIKKFFVSRVFRLWPGYIAAVLLAVVAIFLINNIFTWNQFNETFVKNASHVYEEILLFRFNNNFYGAGWTLTIEMIASFIFPFFLVLAIKDVRLIQYLLIVFIVIIGKNFFFSEHFLLGILICSYYPKINNRTEIMKSRWFRYRFLFIGLAFVLFSYRYYGQLVHFPTPYTSVVNFMGWEDFSFSGLASGIFLVSIIYYQNIQRILNAKILVFLGKISYSLYLVHPSIIAMIHRLILPYIRGLGPRRLLALEGFMSLVACIGASVLLYYGLELPFIRLGKRIAARMKPSLIVGIGK